MGDRLFLDFEGAVAFDAAHGRITVSPTIETISSDGHPGREIQLTKTSQVAISHKVLEVFKTQPLFRYASDGKIIERVANILEKVFDSMVSGPKIEMDPSDWAEEALQLDIGPREADPESYRRGQLSALGTTMALNQIMSSIMEYVNADLHNTAQEYPAPLDSQIIGSFSDIRAQLEPGLSTWLQDNCLSEGHIGQYKVHTNFSRPSRGTFVGWVYVAYTDMSLSIPFDVSLGGSTE